MENSQDYIIAGILCAFEPPKPSKSGFEVSAFTLEDIRGKLTEKYNVLLSPDVLKAALDRMASGIDDEDYFRVYSSPFAQDHFHIDTSQADYLASMVAIDAVWDATSKLGNNWLRESLGTIEKLIDSEEDDHDMESQDLSPTIPASDRYVKLSDNQEKVSELSESVEELKQAVVGLNTIEEEERQIALSEIAIFEATLIQPQLSIDLIERFLAFCKIRLASILSASVAAVIVERLSGMIDAFLKSLFLTT